MEDRTEKIMKAIGFLYDAAINPDLWEKYIDHVSEMVNGNTSVLILNPNGTPAHQLKQLGPSTYKNSNTLAKYKNFPEEQQKVYMEKFFFEGDVWLQCLRKHRITNDAFQGTELISMEELRATDFYKEVFNAGEHPNDYIVGHMIDATPAGWTSYSVSRPESKGDYTKEDKKVFELLVPHMQRARLIYSHYEELRGSEAGLKDALNTSVSSIVLVDSTGGVIFVNEGAEKIFSEEDGIFYKDRNIFLADSDQDRELDQSISKSIQTSMGASTYGGSGIRVKRPSNKAPYRLFVTPLNPRSEQKRIDPKAAAAIFVYDPSELKLPSADILKSMYKLTDSEAAVAQLFYQCFDLKKISEKLDLKITTIRSHFYRVLEKTETNSQPELMLLLDQLPRVGNNEN